MNGDDILIELAERVGILYGKGGLNERLNRSLGDAFKIDINKKYTWEDLFDRPNLYRTPQGDYYDNLERFAFFCQVALFFARGTGFQFDVVHCHDWQTGLVPAYLKTLLALDPFFL